MSDRFNDYAADAAAEIQHRDGLTIPPTIHRDITLAIDRGYDAFWGVVGTAMQTHGISGDDLGWDDSDARSALARAVISLIAPNLPAKPYECTVVLRMPADNTCPCGERLIPTDLDDVLAALDAGYVTAADLEQHAEYVTYQRAAESAARGQAGRSAKWGAVAKDGTPWQTPEEIALLKVRAIRDLAAHDARHAALAAHAFGGPKTEDLIPF
jgi:hypothetical protein